MLAPWKTARRHSEAFEYTALGGACASRRSNTERGCNRERQREGEMYEDLKARTHGALERTGPTLAHICHSVFSSFFLNEFPSVPTRRGLKALDFDLIVFLRASIL